jgi:hypothetical protein
MYGLKPVPFTLKLAGFVGLKPHAPSVAVAESHLRHKNKGVSKMGHPGAEGLGREKQRQRRRVVVGESFISGATFWFVGPRECPRTRAVDYQAKRHGSDVLALVVQKQKKSSRPAPKQCELFLGSGMRKRMGCL